MRRREIMMLAGAAVTLPYWARAQQSGGPKHVAVMMSDLETDPAGQAGIAALTAGLAKLGWVDGQNLHITYSWSSSNDRQSLARDATAVIASLPDVIVCEAPPVTDAVRHQTQTIPIVFVIVSDPVGYGFISNLAHPGGNLTGITTFEFSMGAKWLGLLREIAPAVKSVAVVYQPSITPGYDTYWTSVKAAADALGLPSQLALVRDVTMIESVMSALAAQTSMGLIFPPETFTSTHRAQFAEAARRLGLPAIYASIDFAEAGGLIAYGFNRRDQFNQIAGYIDRLLRGATPSELPVEEPNKFDLAINLKTAKAMGLVVPKSLLATADQVIE